eukprot:CAMPEP_0172196550 /NCGR_PEP_ID=MMETSP1050-20130122/26898_1 /TAXON_ID=233186 /ORGANISM="Cryptomonas curvata, Strain CCAP979/52" /LENGTH=57 /DNA_ID=CAMNT_0012872881 /DNA_START=434 /DNA_END=604 /DNA_ORIENTATION=+
MTNTARHPRCAALSHAAHRRPERWPSQEEEERGGIPSRRTSPSHGPSHGPRRGVRLL